MTHQWKIGDWCETSAGRRGFVVDADCDGDLRVYFKDERATSLVKIAKHLPLCDSWDWQPPSPPDPGEGYRAIDPAVDKPQEGDEIWRVDGLGWRRRRAIGPYDANRHYRRKLPPTYTHFTAETFKPHRDRWIRYEGHPGALRIDNYDEYGFIIGADKYPWSDLLDSSYVFDDTNTPCGVPQ